MMKRYLFYIYAATMACGMASCGSNDLDGYLTPSEESLSPMTFNAAHSSDGTRAATIPDGYRPWSQTTDPESMGVFGYFDVSGGMTNENTMFKNVENTYSGNRHTANNAWVAETAGWTYADPQYWADYTQHSTWDFVGYMPYVAGATVANATDDYTLSFPVALDKVILTREDSKDMPLICHQSYHLDTPGQNPIPFDMDQTLAGYSIQFALGAKMDNVRDFRIKYVKVYGTNIPTSGTVSRTYPKAGGDAGDITWTSVAGSLEITKTSAIDIVRKDKDANNRDDDLVLYNGTPGSEAYVKWGDPTDKLDGAFFTIPSASFNPTIEVTYDVYVDDGTAKDVLTRENVVSTIVFNEGNFSAYTTAAAVGKITPIKIKIVPSYLYVLADADQKQGFLVVDTP